MNKFKIVLSFAHPLPFVTGYKAGRKRRLVPRANLDLMKRLCQGDRVNVRGFDEPVVVHVVDQFHQSITILSGKEERVVDVADLLVGKYYFWLL